MKYRYHGKEKLIAFGRYPDLTLLNARKARDAACSELATGFDPGELRKSLREDARREAQHTFAALAEAYIAEQRAERRARSILAKNEWLLDMTIRDFGSTTVANVKAPLILRTLRKVEARGSYLRDVALLSPTDPVFSSNSRYSS